MQPKTTMSKLSQLVSPIAMAMFAMVSTSAWAQSTWTLDTSRAAVGTQFSSLSANQCAQGSTAANNYGNTWNCKSGSDSQQLTASAWSTDRGGITYQGNVRETYVYTGYRSSTTGNWVSNSSYRTVLRPNTSGTWDYVTYDNSGNQVSQSGISSTGTRTQTQVSSISGLVSQYQAPSAGGGSFSSAFMNDQGSSGFGATNRTEAIRNSAGGNHAFDSVSPGLGEMVLLQFDSAVILNQFRMGWTGTDGDISILRWTGDTAPAQSTSPTTAVSGDREVNLSAQQADGAMVGWELVSHFGNVGTATIGTGFSAASSWWLISTYNTTLAKNTMACSGCDVGNDAFKIEFLKVSNYTCPGTPTPGGNCTPPPSSGVPTPGSMALAGLGLGGLLLRRRRRQSAAA